MKLEAPVALLHAASPLAAPALAVSCPQCSQTGKSPSLPSPQDTRPHPWASGPPATGGQAASGRGCAPAGRWEGPVLPSPAPAAPHCSPLRLPWLRRDSRALGRQGWRLQPTCGTFYMAPWALGTVCTQASSGQPPLTPCPGPRGSPSPGCAPPLDAPLPHSSPGSVPATECARAGPRV